jgi:putative Ca2+/H+ antiporter (TMEM165/GDT1 family)
MMRWVRVVVGVLCALLGLVWLGQGLNLIKGSFMTGQTQWAVIGALLLVVAVWLLWGALRRSSDTAVRP